LRRFFYFVGWIDYFGIDFLYTP